MKHRSKDSIIFGFLNMVCSARCWILAGHTYLRKPKSFHDLLELLSMLHLNLYELWNCSSASLVSFWAWCALLFLKKCSHVSLRFIWELVFFKKFSLASLRLFWEKEKFMLMIFTYICLSLSKATYENSPKVIDIQGGYNKNFHEDHWAK